MMCPSDAERLTIRAESFAMSDFSRILAEARVHAGLTQAQLAETIRVSEATIASWETGRRRPSWRGRAKIIECADRLGIAASERNVMLQSVGRAPVPSGRFAPLLDRRKPMAILRGECSRYSWPTLAMNEDYEVVAWNEAANDLSELDFGTELAEPGARHLLRMALSPHFATKLQNWEEVIGVMVGMWKTTGFDILSPGSRTPYFDNLISYILTNHGNQVGRLLSIWQNAAPHIEGSRVYFKMSWLTSSNEPLAFHCQMTSWSDFDGVSAFDWHPADGATWTWLEARRASRLALNEGSRPAENESLPTTARQLLRFARQKNGLTQAQLGQRAGLSEDIVYSMESGRKPMTEPTLLSLGQALALDAADLNSLLEAAGFEPKVSEHLPYILGFNVSDNPRYGQSLNYRMNWTPSAVEREVENYPWPALVVNARCEVIVTNRPTRRIFGPLRSQVSGGGLASNLFALVTDPSFRVATGNWQEVVANILPGNLEAYMAPEGAARGLLKDEAYFASVVDYIRSRETNAGRGDNVIREAFNAWRAMPARRLTARVAFEMQWTMSDGRLLFDAVITPWSAMRDPYWAIDLHPADATTWRLLLPA